MWISQTDLLDYIDLQSLTQLTDDDGDGASDGSLIDNAIARGIGLVKEAMEKVYEVPGDDDTVPETVKDLCARLAIRQLWQRRHGIGMNQSELPEMLSGLDDRLSSLRDEDLGLKSYLGSRASFGLFSDEGSISEGF